ncbi:MAG TPA: alcohol dehydrogenase catalytic domain-containing protein [Chthoniobacterales bacterium]|nr:alcohol dehydrogenase catalytic domain-containing protein [Chthoniobacterales bacterium]
MGRWDPFEREGGFAREFGIEAKFPYVLGSDGAGTLEAVGDRVKGLKPGDRVYAFAFLNPKGGFYAEYAADSVSLRYTTKHGDACDSSGNFAYGSRFCSLRRGAVLVIIDFKNLF